MLNEHDAFLIGDANTLAGGFRYVRCSVASSREVQLQSEAERFVEALQSEAAEFEEPSDQTASLQAAYEASKEKV